MLDSFLNGEFYIKITTEDKDLLYDLDRKLDCIWKATSKDVLNTGWFKSIIDKNGAIYLHNGKNGITYTRTIPNTYCLLKDFLYEKEIEIQDEDLLEMFE